MVPALLIGIYLLIIFSILIIILAFLAIFYAFFITGVGISLIN